MVIDREGTVGERGGSMRGVEVEREGESDGGGRAIGVLKTTGRM